MLTPKQKQINDYIHRIISKKDISPTEREIAHYFKISPSTTHEHLKTLEKKGYLESADGRARGIRIASATPHLIQIPLLGIIAAGQPLDTFPNKEKISIPKPKSFQTGDLFALKVLGDSMVEDGILDGDTIVIKKQNTVSDGEIGVALLPGGEMTLKKIYRQKNGFRLQPANSKYKPVYTKELIIQGKLFSVIRQMENSENSQDSNSEPELTKETTNYIRESEQAYRKSLGQYFTPRSIREALLEKLPKNLNSPKILDPACGTGEFLITAKKMFPNASIYGWDIDKKLIEISRHVSPNTSLKNINSLKDTSYEIFDFVIGNPPYFEFKPEKSLKEKFKDAISGRPNIFSLFIYQGLKWLKNGGYLAFVVPPSMNNGAYFSNLRNFIINNANIEHLEIIKDSKIFHGAQQSTMLIVLKKGENKGNYIFQKNGISIFSENHTKLSAIFKKTTSLAELGFTVRTGRIVWNQNRHFLTHESKNGTPLIWAHNISSNNLSLKLETGIAKKPQYITRKDYDIGPAIVVNRITGSVSGTKLRAAIVPRNVKFFAENHVNVIFPPKEEPEKRKGVIPSIDQIAEQISSSQKSNIMKDITGNTQISKTELEKLFPITLS